LGYSAVALSAVAFYLDWTLGFEKTKTLTAALVVAYFTLNGALTYWIWGVEKGRVFEGELNGVWVCT
jgi:signal peptidase complex subunit 2